MPELSQEIECRPLDRLAVERIIPLDAWISDGIHVYGEVFCQVSMDPGLVCLMARRKVALLGYTFCQGVQCGFALGFAQALRRKGEQAGVQPKSVGELVFCGDAGRVGGVMAGMRRK